MELWQIIFKFIENHAKEISITLALTTFFISHVFFKIKDNTLSLLKDGGSEDYSKRLENWQFSHKTYRPRLEFLLNKLDKFFNSKADNFLKPSPHAFSKSLLLAFIYPFLSIFITWVFFDYFPEIFNTLLPTNIFSIGQRIWDLALIILCIGFIYRIIKQYFKQDKNNFKEYIIFLIKLALLYLALWYFSKNTVAVAVAVAGGVAVGVVVVVVTQLSNIKTVRLSVFYWLFILISLTLYLVYILILSNDSKFNQINFILLFFLLLPCLNAVFDWLSIHVTRSLLNKSLSTTNILCTLIYSLVDFILAILLFVMLASSITVFIAIGNNLAAPNVTFDLKGLLESLKSGWDINYSWVYFMLFSTLLPTFIHILISLSIFFPCRLPSSLLQNSIQNLKKLNNTNKKEFILHRNSLAWKITTFSIIRWLIAPIMVLIILSISLKIFAVIKVYLYIALSFLLDNLIIINNFISSLLL